MPNLDCADDEELACHHGDLSPQEGTNMHISESFVRDEVFKDVLIAISPSPSITTFLDSRSDGDNEFLIGIEHHHHRDILEEDHDDLPALDSAGEFERLPFQPEPIFDRHMAPSDYFHNVNHTASPPVLDLDDSDNETSFDSSQATSQNGYNSLEDLVLESDSRLSNSFDGHIAQDEVFSDQDSQDEVSRVLGKEDESQAKPTDPFASSLLPSISGLVLIHGDRSMEQLHSIDYWPHHSITITSRDDDDMDIFATEDASQAIPLKEFASDDDLELGFLSDSTCHSDRNRMELEPNHSIFENSGDSVGVVARVGFSGTTFSHQRTTLNITWPSQAESTHQLRHTLDATEDSDEEFWNVEAHKGDVPCAEEEETSFTMLELDHFAP
ncbi:hypothetical protein H0H87_005034 [Tephrocybe sp. NHM501043]|nr:hypothetical protein H0H87_005034 [Tephrocybe sp. NHM501043]